MVGVYLWGGWQEKIVLAPSFIAIGTALLLIGSECTLPPVLRFLTGPAPVLSSFGRRSYEIYLFHLVVIESMWIVSADLKFNLAVYSPLWLFAFLCVAYGVAYLIFRFWSEPMNHLIRHVLKRSGPPQTEARRDATLKGIKSKKDSTALQISARPLCGSLPPEDLARISRAPEKCAQSADPAAAGSGQPRTHSPRRATSQAARGG